MRLLWESMGSCIPSTENSAWPAVTIQPMLYVIIMTIIVATGEHQPSLLLFPRERPTWAINGMNILSFSHLRAGGLLNKITCNSYTFRAGALSPSSSSPGSSPCLSSEQASVALGSRLGTTRRWTQWDPAPVRQVGMMPNKSQRTGDPAMGQQVPEEPKRC